MTERPTVRAGTASDAAEAAAVLGTAFEHTAFTAHTIAADHRLDRLVQLHRLLVDAVALPHGRMWVSDPVRAASLWVAPGSADADAHLDALETAIEGIAGPAFASANRTAKSAMAEHAPDGPAWYLASVGVHPRYQGRGLGTAVIRPGLALADEESLPVYLETSVPRNVELYERLGFRTTARYELPEGGPTTWTMVRHTP